MSTITTRRFCMLKRRAAQRTGEHALAAAWLTKQLEEPGTPMAPSVPHQARLEACGYFAAEDLAGATEKELLNAGLTQRETRAVLAALEAIS